MRRGVGMITVVCAGLLGCGPGAGGAGNGSGTTPGPTARVTPPEYPVPLLPRVESGRTPAPRNGVTVEVPSAAVVGGKLHVFLRVSAVEPGREVTLQSWREGKWVRLADDRGAIYKPSPAAGDGPLAELVRSRFGSGVAFGSGPVRPGQPRVDVLVYEPPSPAATHIDLDLDGRNLGSEDPYLFRIPRATWQPVAPTPTQTPGATRRN